MVNGEQSRSQRMIGLPFTVYCLPHALRSALCVKGQAKAGAFGRMALLNRSVFLAFYNSVL